MVSLIKKMLHRVMDYIEKKDVMITFDDSNASCEKYLNCSNVFVKGDKELVDNFTKKLSIWGGCCSDRIEECTKFVIISMLQSQDIGLKNQWIYNTGLLKTAFFLSRQCAENLIKRKARGTILHIIVTDRESEPFQFMIQGMAKQFGQSHIRVNGIFVDKDRIDTIDYMTAYLLDRHSLHINGECIKAC